MVKFVSVFGITILLLILVTLMWPRFTDAPRPQPLERLNEIIRGTPVGQNTAAVLGVSSEDTIEKLTPQSVLNGIITTAEKRAIDVAVTQIVREITRRFKNLPREHQRRILDAIGNSIDTASSSSTPDAP